VAGAIDPKTGAKRLLAAPVTVAALSPDGKTLATVFEKHLGFLATDGTRATAFRWQKDLSASGIVWADDKTLALVTLEDKAPRIELVRTDGTVARTIEVPKPQETKETVTGELAIAPGGKHLVLAYAKEVHFLDAAGKTLAQWTGKDAMLAQPTFTPDGKRVAFKRLTERDGGSAIVTDIVFFSPDGKELLAVPLPPPPATQPATAPVAKPGT
jgi:Tol biopolymer transport system component